MNPKETLPAQVARIDARLLNEDPAIANIRRSVMEKLHKAGIDATVNKAGKIEPGWTGISEIIQETREKALQATGFNTPTPQQSSDIDKLSEELEHKGTGGTITKTSFQEHGQKKTPSEKVSKTA